MWWAYIRGAYIRGAYSQRFMVFDMCVCESYSAPPLAPLRIFGGRGGMAPFLPMNAHTPSHS